MAYSASFLDDLRARLPVSQVVGQTVALKRKGGELVGLSPFQEERSPSFTVNDAKGLWKDFSSGRGGDIFKFLMESRGLDFRSAVEECAKIAGIPVPKSNGNGSNGNGGAKASLPEDPPFDPSAYADRQPDPPKQKTKREITQHYDYTDVAGNLLYQVCRIEWEEDGKKKKNFMQRRPSGIGKSWVWGLSAGEFIQGRDGDFYQATKDRLETWRDADQRTFPTGVQHGLYRLLELREEGDPNSTVFLPEGEKDVETLRFMGLVATTNSGGARNWRPEHAEALRDRDVVILLDNDQPGRDRGELIAMSLRGIAKRIRLVDFTRVWPDAKKGADVTDWVRAREGTAEELLEIANETVDWTPPPFQSKFGGFPFEALDEPGEEHEHLIDGILTVGDKSIIGGASRSGKSFLAIDACMSIATGQAFFGHKVMRQGLVVYQAGEGGRGIKKRFRAWRQYHAIDRHAKVPVYILPSRIDIHSPEGDTAKLIEELHGIEKLYAMPILALFVDTLAKASGTADENSGRDMGVVMGNVDKIGDVFPRMHVCLVHHMNAGGTKLRGHTSVHAGVDQVILVTRDELKPKNRTATLDKQKDEEDGAQIQFVLHPMTVGYREVDGAPITSCVPLPQFAQVDFKVSGTPAMDRAKKLSDNNAVIFQCLKDAMAENGIKPPPELGLPKTVTQVVEYKHWKNHYVAKASDVSETTIQKQMKRASDKLLRLKLIGRINPHIWLTERGTFAAASELSEPHGDVSPDQAEFPED